MPNGKFIVLEGIDGAGTTTQAERLQAHLRSRGLDCLVTREPTPGPIGSVIRQILSGRLKGACVDGKDGQVPNDVIALLFAADRLDHLACEIEPALAAGRWVISDRYVHSSIIYQSVEGELAWIRSLNNRARVADLCLVLDLSAEQAEQRRSGRASEEIYEKLEFQRKVAQAYRDLPDMYPEQAIRVLDGALPVDAVTEALIAAVGQQFGL